MSFCLQISPLAWSETQPSYRTGLFAPGLRHPDIALLPFSRPLTFSAKVKLGTPILPGK